MGAAHAEKPGHRLLHFMVYGSEAILPTDIAFGAPHTQNYDKGEAKTTRQTDLDLAEEHRLTAALQHARYEQQLCRYHDKNVQQRDFNVGDLVLRQVQTPGGKLTPPMGRALHREQCSCPRNL